MLISRMLWKYYQNPTGTDEFSERSRIFRGSGIDRYTQGRYYTTVENCREARRIFDKLRKWDSGKYYRLYIQMRRTKVELTSFETDYIELIRALADEVRHPTTGPAEQR